MRRLIIRLIGVSFGVGVALLLFSGVAFGSGYQAHAATARPSASIGFRNINRFPVRNIRISHQNARINVHRNIRVNVHRNIRVNVHRNIRVNVHRNIRVNVHRNVRIIVRQNVRVRVLVNFRTNVVIRSNRFNTIRSPIFGPCSFGTSCFSCCHGFGVR